MIWYKFLSWTGPNVLLVPLTRAYKAQRNLRGEFLKLTHPECVLCFGLVLGCKTGIVEMSERALTELCAASFHVNT